MKEKTGKSRAPILIIGVLFFIFGFITWLNATLIPYLKLACQLETDLEAYLVTFAFYISYFVMALPSSWILRKTGFKNGMSLGIIIMAIGALIFIPAALTRTYGLFLTGLFIQGTGLAVLQTASNPYVIILGPIESAARRISIMGIANKVAGIISPMILGAIVLTGTDELVEHLETLDAVGKAAELDILAAKVILPYIIIAIGLVILALVIRLSSLPEVEEEKNQDKGNMDRKSIFQFPYLILGVMAIFLYVGAEVIAVDTLIPYGTFWGIDFSEARFFASFTLLIMIAGYLTGIITIPGLIKQDKALVICAVLGVVFSIIAIFTKGYTSVLFIGLLGFSNALMWPAIWPLAIEGLGKFTKTGSALLIMGIIGGGIMTLLYGYLSDIYGSKQQAYWILIPCYLFILYYAISGNKVGKKQ